MGCISSSTSTSVVNTSAAVVTNSPCTKDITFDPESPVPAIKVRSPDTKESTDDGSASVDVPGSVPQDSPELDTSTTRAPAEIPRAVGSTVSDAALKSETPQANPSRKPQGNLSSEPLGNPASVPQAKALNEPHAKALNESQAKALNEPQANASNESQAKAVNEPHASSSSEPKGTPSSESQAKALNEPHASPSSEPKGNPSNESQAKAVNEPHASSSSEPKGTPSSESQAKALNEPHANPSRAPQANAASEPEPTSPAEVNPSSKPPLTTGEAVPIAGKPDAITEEKTAATEDAGESRQLASPEEKNNTDSERKLSTTPMESRRRASQDDMAPFVFHQQKIDRNFSRRSHATSSSHSHGKARKELRDGASSSSGLSSDSEDGADKDARKCLRRGKRAQTASALQNDPSRAGRRADTTYDEMAARTMNEKHMKEQAKQLSELRDRVAKKMQKENETYAVFQST
eukprot:GEMP01039530.1.p1 GENE.GEMP01039530.1~~GEMP01039530.1.p1  ORF type:complete len:484 (+),score=113.56 GEMP01039530.1:64-1452(+)